MSLPAVLQRRGRFRAVPVLILVLACLAAGVWFYEDQTAERETEVLNELLSLARTRADLLAAWRGKSVLTAELIGAVLPHERSGSHPPLSSAAITAVQTVFAANGGGREFRRVTILSGTGAVIASVPDSGAVNLISVFSQFAIHATGPFVTDLVKFADGSHRVLTVVPVSLPNGDRSLIIVQSDPGAVFGALVKPWRTYGVGVEVVVTRREREGLVPVSEGGIVIPSSALPVDTGAARTGQAKDITDATGSRMLVAAVESPDTPWVLVARVDRAALFSQFRLVAWFIVVSVGLLLMGLVFFTREWWTRHEVDEDRKRLDLEIEHQALVQHFDELTRHANDIILLMDDSGAILEANLRASEAYQYGEQELRSLNIRQLRLPDPTTGEAVTPEGFTNGHGQVFEAVHRRKDGSVFLVEESMRVIDVRGRRFFQSIIRDITARRRAEDALRAAEERYRQLFEHAGAGIAYFDTTGSLLIINDEAARNLGAVPHHLQGKHVLEILPPEQARELLDRLNAVVERGLPLTREDEFQRAGGTTWFLSTFQPIRNSAGAIAGIQVISQNITAVKNLESDLQESEERFEKSFRLSPDAMMIGKRHGATIIEVNQSWERLFGYRREDVLGRSALQIPLLREGPERDRGINLLRTVGSVRDFEAVAVHRSGEERIVSISAETIVIDDEPCVLILMRDLTDRLTAEAALRESEQRFRLLAENAQDAIYRMALPSGRYEYLSPAIRRMTGFLPEEFIAAPSLFRTILHPDFHEYYREMWDRLMHGDVPPTYEYAVIRKGGDTRWLNQRNTLIRDDEGRPIAIEGIVTDITERMQQELALRMSERRSRMLVDGLGAGLVQTDNDGVIQFVNERFCQMTGYTPEDLVGRLAVEVLPADAKEAERLRQKLIDRRRGEAEEYELQEKLKSGEVRWMRIIGTPLQDASGAIVGTVGVHMDIEERRRLDSQIRRLTRAVDQASDVVFMTDTSGVITYVNPAFEVLYGYTSQEVLGRTPRLLKSGQMTDEYYREFWQKITSGHNVRGNHANRTKDGRVVVVEASVSAVHDASGAIVGFIAVQHDLSETRMQ